ncbi:MAG: hypothetical protein RMM17_10840 [Acidobacteriota bacterium]|nr:hypothetical protein [Blastocatellia bacterium]MDW8413168.1 hypothetical protein [Acidobacteriota bacterium]
MSHSRRSKLKNLGKAGTTNAGLWLDRYLEFHDKKTGETSSQEQKSRQKLVEQVAEICARRLNIFMNYGRKV